MDINSIVKLSMQNIGIFIEENRDKELDIDLRDYIKDSISFISFIIELETNLEIEIPYEMLAYESLTSFNGFCNMLCELVLKSK